MDWSSVTWEEVRDAMKEVEWSSPPRPFSEFFSKFAGLRSSINWSSRLKCNLYVYRANYFLLFAITLLLGTALARSWIAFVGALIALFGIACLNDSFATSFSERVTKAARRVYPPLAAKMRVPHTPGGRGGLSRGKVYMCGKDRRLVSSGLAFVSLLLWFISSATKLILGASAVSFFLILIHASFRTPNLKARLNTFREEFRAVWRSYSDL